MIKGLRGATTWSEDLNNLLPFYRDLLGLPVAIQMSRWRPTTSTASGSGSRRRAWSSSRSRPIPVSSASRLCATRRAIWFSCCSRG